MNRTLLFIGLLLYSITNTSAQETRLFMPKEIKKAYDNGTRSYDGKPGSAYWQNTVDYDISVKVIPETRELIGSESVVYYNNSPDDLSLLIIRLYNDAFRKGNARAMRVKESDINDGVEISKLTVNGKDIDLDQQVSRRGTNMYIQLAEPLAKNSSTTIEVDWKMVISETTERTGAYDSTSFFVAYWYPQLAVYDDVFGWDQLSYDFSTEFYNNLGNYKVKITAPENFSVVATGVLQNPDKVFKSDKLALYNQAKSSNETITIVSADDVTNGYSHQSGTWNYEASEVSDFSFCLSDHFVWDAAILKVTPDRDVLIHSFYNITMAEKAAELTAIQQKAMKHFSENMPGVPYPYPEFTSCVMGVRGGGMETPMMANNGGPNEGVTVHEMFHTYFPMYVRTNEKRFAWMDEGWADFNTSYTLKRGFKDDNSLLVDDFSYIQSTMGSISDLPLITSTQFMDNSNYGYASYPLPAFMYSMLHQHLGDDLFKQCYREYINTWAKKSPTPYDFFYTFERVSGQDLSWLWKPWFFNYGNVDVAIESFEKGKLIIRNKESRPLPVVISVMYKDSTTWNSDFSGEVWKSSNTFTQEIPKYKKIITLTVNAGLPDANIVDNYYPSIKDQYGDFKVVAKHLGDYQIIEFPITVTIFEKDELLQFSAKEAGIDTYLLPRGNNTYVSLDGNLIIKLVDEESTVAISLEFKNYGMTVTGSKE